MIYLASPYSTSNYLVKEQRFETAEFVTAALLQRLRIPIYSPIVAFHELAKKYSLPTDAGYWEKQNTAFLRRATEFYLIKIPGREESKGCQQELSLARTLQLQIHYVDEYGLEVL